MLLLFLGYVLVIQRAVKYMPWEGSLFCSNVPASMYSYGYNPFTNLNQLALCFISSKLRSVLEFYGGMLFTSES